MKFPFEIFSKGNFCVYIFFLVGVKKGEKWNKKSLKYVKTSIIIKEYIYA